MTTTSKCQVSELLHPCVAINQVYLMCFAGGGYGVQLHAGGRETYATSMIFQGNRVSSAVGVMHSCVFHVEMDAERLLMLQILALALAKGITSLFPGDLL